MNVALVCFSLYILRDDARVGNERSRNMREREKEKKKKKKNNEPTQQLNGTIVIYR